MVSNQQGLFRAIQAHVRENAIFMVLTVFPQGKSTGIDTNDKKSSHKHRYIIFSHFSGRSGIQVDIVSFNLRHVQKSDDVQISDVGQTHGRTDGHIPPTSYFW